MKIKTSELIDTALDWAVANALGYHWSLNGYFVWNELGHRTKYTKECPPYSTDWAQGGPIIEREEICTKRRAPCMKGEEWEAMGSITAKGTGYRYAIGPTPLIAALRCYVASKLGDEVDVPDEIAARIETALNLLADQQNSSWKFKRYEISDVVDAVAPDGRVFSVAPSELSREAAELFNAMVDALISRKR